LTINENSTCVNKSIWNTGGKTVKIPDLTVLFISVHLITVIVALRIFLNHFLCVPTQMGGEVGRG
jgi:hypothetical protein